MPRVLRGRCAGLRVGRRSAAVYPADWRKVRTLRVTMKRFKERACLKPILVTPGSLSPRGIAYLLIVISRDPQRHLIGPCPIWVATRADRAVWRLSQLGGLWV